MKKNASLKLYCAEAVFRSKISKEGKIQLLNFIQKEADSYQLMALILDGRIVKKLTETDKQIIKDRFLVEGGAITKVKSFASVAGGTSFYGIPYLIYRTIRGAADKCTKACGTYEFNTVRRQVCMAKCNLAKHQAMLSKTKDTKQKAQLQLKVIKFQKKVANYQAQAKERGTDYK